MLAVAFSAEGRHLNSHLAVEILGGDGIGLEHLLRCALKDNFSSLASCLRTDIYNPVGSPHHIFIVLHHNNGIAQVAKFLQTVEQTFVVALVQTDARLIEDIEHVDQLATNLSSQTDALALTSRERSRLAVEREIIESHI